MGISSLLKAGWGRFHPLLPTSADFVAMRRNPRRDVIAGVTVALVALPLALAFGIASGAGAAAGLVTAIVAGVVAAVFGGSNLQVSGPTGAMTVVIIPIIAHFGVNGVLVVGIMAGLILIALAVARAGRAMQYVPLPVIEGFTLGIAVIIGLQQVPVALGQHPHDTRVVSSAWQAIVAFAQSPQWASVGVTACVALAILLARRVRPGLPIALPAVIAITVVTWIAHLNVELIGALPSGLPVPSLPEIPWADLPELIAPAVAIAALAGLESLLCATVADAMCVGQRHDANRELFGQGLANVVSPLFAGVPATAAIARTAVNVRTGARSRLGALTQSLVLLLVVLVASRWVGFIPLAALAGVLLATVIHMVDISNLRALLQATRGDAAVLVVTAAVTIAFDLVAAVVVGLMVAGLLALWQMSKSAQLDQLPIDNGEHSQEEQSLLDDHIVAYRLDGPLFFGAAHQFLLELSRLSDVKVVILRLSRVNTLDATGAAVLGDTIRSLERRGTTVLLSGIRDEHDGVFRALGVYQGLADHRHVFDSTPEAIAHARAHVRSAGHAPEGSAPAT